MNLWCCIDESKLYCISGIFSTGLPLIPPELLTQRIRTNRASERLTVRVQETRQRSFVDLFAGCGGLSLGLEIAGFQPVFVSELNRDALDTYLLNRKTRFRLLQEDKYHCRDVTDMTKDGGALLDKLVRNLARDHGIDTNTGDLDLLVGGPPCQGFSRIGHRRSYPVDGSKIPSNLLYRDMAKVIDHLRPKIFLFENVRGLLGARWTSGGKKGEIWDDVQRTFDQLEGYEIAHELVYAWEYGVPQNRPRILLVGVRRDLSIDIEDNCPAGGLLPRPSGGYPNLKELWSDLVDPDYEPGGQTTEYPHDPLSEIQEYLRRDPVGERISAKGDPVLEHKYTRHSERVIARFKFMLHNQGRIPEHMKTRKFSQRLLPARWGSDGPNITATSLPDDYVHYCQPRSLTVREWARLQMFPDWYQFAGKRTTGGIRRAGNPREGIFDRELPKYTQIGNAVPVELARKLGNHFQRLLGKRG